MANTNTSIEWTDATWSPVTGCQKVSPGCKHCYAEGVAERFWAKQYPPNADGSPRRFTDIRCHPERLDQPLRWRKPRRVFVNSMSDLFHEDVPIDFIVSAWATMARAEQHTFQILTKRPERMRECAALLRTLPNVWLGVSVEDQRRADERREYLQETPAAVRFVSYEPALGEVDWTGWEFIDWLIVGGESGPGARPFDLAWARDAIAWAGAHGVAAFIKQIGARPYYLIDRGPTFERVDYPLRDRKGGDMEEWPADLRVRQFPRG